MPDFAYDVFLSYSSKDKKVVRAVAERLQADDLREGAEAGTGLGSPDPRLQRQRRIG